MEAPTKAGPDTAAETTAPLLAQALRPGIVLLDQASTPCWADDRALALLGWRDVAEGKALWPRIWPRMQTEAASRRSIGSEGANGTHGAHHGHQAHDANAADGAHDAHGAHEDACPPGAGAEIAVELPAGGSRRVRVTMVNGAAATRRSPATAPGPHVGCALLLQDAGATTALENDLRAAAQMRSLSQITPAVAHDLRAPINAMVLNLEVLKETLAAAAPAFPSAASAGGRDPRERQQRYVSVLREELTRLHQSLELYLAHVAPRGERLEVIDLREPARDLAALLRPSARKQQVQIEVLLPDSLLPAKVQRHSLRVALLHLGLVVLEQVPRTGTLEIRLEHGADEIDRARLRITAATLPGGANSSPSEGVPVVLPPGAAAPALHGMTESRSSAAFTAARVDAARTLVEALGGSVTARSLPESPAAFEVVFPAAEPN
jgi:hypothetical protein